MRGRFSIWLGRVVLLAASTTLWFVMAEVGFRFYAIGLKAFSYSATKSVVRVDQAGLLRPADEPSIEYELKPNLDKLFKLARVRTSSAGLNDREYTLEKPPGIYRVVVLGDSMTMASGVEREESWHAVLDERLNLESPSLRYEFINFGVGGYHPGNYRAVLEHRAMGYDPDLVLIGFTPRNDHEFPQFRRRFTPKPERNAFFSSFIVDVAKNFYMGWREGSLTRRFPPLTEAQARALTSVLAAIKRRCEAARIPVVLLYLARHEDLRLASVQKVTDGLGIELIDTTPAFRDVPFNDTKIFRTDGHPNAFAHRLFAETVYDHLGERLEHARPVRAALAPP